jgi:TPR repeat protein
MPFLSPKQRPQNEIKTLPESKITMSLFGKIQKIVNKIPVNADAIERRRREAESGNVDAQFTLGNLYERGQGVPQDYFESALWYRRAAEQGHAGAQLYLGIYLAQGNGVEQNVVEAFKWIELAKGGSLLDTAAALECQKKLVTFMTQEQIDEGLELAREFHPVKS